MSSDLGFIQYAKGGVGGKNIVTMYWYFTHDEKQLLARTPSNSATVFNWKLMQELCKKMMQICSDVRRDDCKLLVVPGEFMTGMCTWKLLSTRTTLWIAFATQAGNKELCDLLLSDDSLMNISAVCTGTCAGIFNRLARIRLTRPMDLKVQFGPPFADFVRERWPMRPSKGDPAWFVRANSGAEIMDMVRITPSAEAGPGYVFVLDEGGKNPKVVNMKKGDPEAQDLACRVVDYILGEFEKGTRISELFAAMPELFVSQMKPKLDYHECEDVFKKDIYGRSVEKPEKTRPYFAYQYHFSLLFSVITQLIGSIQENYQENPHSWSMIGHSWMHGGTQRLWDFLTASGDYSATGNTHCLFYGDDAVYRFVFVIGGVVTTVVWTPDISGMDFTLFPETCVSFSEFINNEIIRSMRSEVVVADNAFYPQKWRAVVNMWGILAVMCPFVFIGKHVIQLLRGLRSGIPGTTYFDEWQSFRIYWWLNENGLEKGLDKIRRQYASQKYTPAVIESLRDDVQELLNQLVSKLKNKVGIEVKAKTMTCYSPDTFIPDKFSSRAITPYAILGYHLTKVDGTVVPIKKIDDLWRSLVKPRTNYKNGAVADMAELERLRGIAIASGWLYPNTYKFLANYFRERRTTGKVNLNPKGQITTINLPLYPLSSVPEEIIQQMKDEEFSGFDEMVNSMYGEETEWEELLGVEFSKLILGDPDWFPDPQWIADLYNLPRAVVEKETNFQLSELVPTTKQAVNLFELAEAKKWSDMMDEEDDIATDEVREKLEAVDIKQANLMHARMEGDKVILTQVSSEKPKPVERTLPILPTAIATGATSRNERRIQELLAEQAKLAAELRAAGWQNQEPEEKPADSVVAEVKVEKEAAPVSQPKFIRTRPVKVKTASRRRESEAPAKKRTPKRGSRVASSRESSTSSDVGEVEMKDLGFM